MSKSEGNVVTIREALETWGREALLLFFLGAHWRKPVDFSDETMAQAQARAETFRNAYTQQKAKRKLQLWDDFADALEDDFDTPRALAVMHEWASNGQHDLLTEALEIFGLKSLSEPEPPPEEIVALAEARQAARDGGRLRGGRPAAGRARGGGMGDARPHRRLRAPAEEGVTADLVYGRRAVREALRGRREVLELWTTERALKAEPWLEEARARVRQERDLTELAGTRDHQGVVARVEPYRYADAYELAAAERPLLAVLDRVTDPRNLGAVCRSRRGRGRDGRRRAGARLGGRDAGGGALVGRRGRAPADRGRHEPGALPRGGEGPGALGARRGGRGRHARCGTPTSAAASRSSSAPRARGCARSSAGPATRSSRSRCSARSSR